MSYYNAGRDGCDILYHLAIFKSIVKRYTPKIVILDINRYEFSVNKTSYDRLSMLLPYYQMHPEIRDIINKKGKFEKYKLISRIYPYNSLLLTIINGFYTKNNQTEDIEGYVPLQEKIDPGKPIVINSLEYTIDSVKLKAFISFINLAKEFDIKIYIVVSPYYTNSNIEDKSLYLAKKIANTCNVPFYDFSNYLPISNNKQLFYDNEHLNNEGAKEFSGIFSKYLKKNA